MVQKRETKAINKLCVREIVSLSFVCGAFFEFRSRNLVCFGIAYNFNGKFAPEAGKTRVRTGFFTRALWEQPFQACSIDADCAVKLDGQNSVNSFLFQNGCSQRF